MNAPNSGLCPREGANREPIVDGHKYPNVEDMANQLLAIDLTAEITKWLDEQAACVSNLIEAISQYRRQCWLTRLMAPSVNPERQVFSCMTLAMTLWKITSKPLLRITGKGAT
jgi:hypothetical protein